MFDGFKKRTLVNAIKNVSLNNIGVYEREVRELLKIDIDNASDEDVEEIMMKARREYFNKVNYTMIETLKVSSPNIGKKVEFLYMPMSRQKEGVMGGRMIDLIYRELTNKDMDSKNAILVNHYQNDLLAEVLHKIENEMLK